MKGGGKDSSKNLHQVRVNKGLEKKQKLRATTHKIKKRLGVHFGTTAKLRTFHVQKTPKEYQNLKNTRLSYKTLPTNKLKFIPTIAKNNTRKNFFKNLEKIQEHQKRISKIRYLMDEDKIKRKRLKTLRILPRRERRKKRIITRYYKDIRELKNLEHKVSKFLEETP